MDTGQSYCGVFVPRSDDFSILSASPAQFKLAINHTRAGVLVQWLKLPAWKVGDRGLEPGYS